MISFSVVMPVYNVKKYLSEAINSILQQEYQDFELIIVDDGSTDGCYEICEQYASQDQRIRVIHQTNRGLLAARRAGIAASSGEYVVHIDSDDRCSTELLLSLKKAIDTYGSDVILYNYITIDENGVRKKAIKIIDKDEGVISKEAVLTAYVNTTYLNAMWIKCTRRDVITNDEDYERYGKFNMAEDELQSAAIYEKASTFFYLPKALYYYRKNNTSITNVYKKTNAINSMVSKKRKWQTVRSNKLLEQSFFFRYIRTYFAYIIEAATVLNSKEEFFEFRDDMRKVELKVPAGMKLPFIEQLMQKVLDRCNYHQVKMMGKLYRVVEESRKL